MTKNNVVPPTTKRVADLPMVSTHGTNGPARHDPVTPSRSTKGAQYELDPPGCLALRIETPDPGECPYTLFLGAGASVSSQIPSVADMIDEWRQEIFRNQKDLAGSDAPIDEAEYHRWLLTTYDSFREELMNTHSTHSEYRALFRYHYRTKEERQIKIEKVVDHKTPSLGYIYLAGLIVGRRFNRVLTTNFDDLLNDALRTYYDRDDRPIVCAFDSAVTSFSAATQRPKIIKLHGDFLYDDMKNVEQELKRLDDNMEDKLREMCRDFGLVVVGYGGDDESIMSPIKEMLRNRNFLKKGLHWCVYCPRQLHEPRRNKISESELPPRLQQLLRDHRDRVHLYAIDSFDGLMELIHARCRLGLPMCLTAPNLSTPTQRFLDAYHQTIISQTPTPRMLQHRREILEIASQRDLSSLQFQIELSDVQWADGQAERDEKQNPVLAAEYFATCLETIELVLNESGALPLALHLRALGRKAGTLIALGKTQRLQKLRTWAQPIFAAISTFKFAQTVFDSQRPLVGSTALAAAELRMASLYYNACCAYGILHGTSFKNPSYQPNDVSQFLLGFGRLQTSEGRLAGRLKLDKLKTESDFKALLDLLPKQ